MLARAAIQFCASLTPANPKEGSVYKTESPFSEMGGDDCLCVRMRQDNVR